MEMLILFFCILPIVAFLYASVGHGGASGYLALMILFNFAIEDMKIIAFILNIFVAGFGFYFFWKKGFFKPRLFLAFAIGSIPAAFVGGMMPINPFWYKKILAVFLVFAILRLLNVFGKEPQKTLDIRWLPAILIGGIIGFTSGMISIGGGIILSPIILLLGWGNMKETAAVSALFIFVNSIFGLLGLIIKGITITIDPLLIILCIAIAVLGGVAGAYWGSSNKNSKELKWVLALVLCIAVFKLVV